MPAVAIGFFDGVHLGHQRILEGADVAVTFRNHPLTVLDAAKAPQLIMSFEDRVAAIRSCGVGEVVALDFTPALASQSPAEFISTLRLRLFSPPSFSLRCGANWRFGSGGEGTPEWLRAHDVGVTVVPAVEYDGGVVSSTRIRDALRRGDVVAANAMMGRRYWVDGVVFSGKGEGTRLGYPTINLSLGGSSPFAASGSLPHGVYQVEVGGCRAIANYGHAPTFGDRAWREAVLEVHLLRGRDEAGGPADEAAAGSSGMKVEFVRFIRSERRFATADELKAQIAADIADLV